MEVSSHALDQDRVAGVRFHSAAFTNLSRDHLDYHESMHAYGEAKARLFALPGLQQAVINVGDAFGRAAAAAAAAAACPSPRCGSDAGESGWMAERTLHAAARATSSCTDSRFELDGSFGTARAARPTDRTIQCRECLLVLACLLSLGVALPAAARRSRRMRGAARAHGDDRGGARRQAARGGRLRAHAGCARKALEALREHCRGALWCVFGCGGDRDPGKRPMMGAVADELADRIIVTDDNPRSEDPRRDHARYRRGHHRARVPGHPRPRRRPSPRR